MDIYEIQETIKKNITVIKKTIVKPLDFDVVIKVPKKNVQQEEKKEEREFKKTS